MATIPGSVRVAGFIAPSDSADTYASHDAVYGRDGLRSVADTTERNAITTDRRREGMVAYVRADGKYYRLGASPWAGTNADWSELVAMGGYSAGTGINIAGSTISLNASIDDLNDVTITPVPTSGQVITYSGSAWVNGTVSLSGMSNLAANSIIGNNTGSPATPLALTTTQVKTLLAIASSDVSGLTAWATKAYPADAAGLLRNNGGGTLSWDTATYLTANQTITLSGDVTGSGTTAITTTIGSNKVTLGMMAQVATATILGRVTASTGNVEALTGTQATSILDLFSTSATTKGLVPGSNGVGTQYFMRADGTWAVPSSFNGIGSNSATASSSTVLDANTFYFTFTGSTPAQTITLPAANLYGAGKTQFIAIKNKSSVPVSISKAGSDTIDGVSSINLPAGSGILVFSNGVSAWDSN